MMKQFRLRPIPSPKLGLRMRITAPWHDFRTPLCGFHCPPSLEPQNSRNLSSSSMLAPSARPLHTWSWQISAKEQGLRGSLSIPTEQKVNDGRFSAADSGEKKFEKLKISCKRQQKKQNAFLKKVLYGLP